ncbi:Alpha/Beta hydrolase protein [Mycena rebaudengoi]|nr:Alpha/Beta hydrolase protein [Mycena rebaudengoi]
MHARTLLPIAIMWTGLAIVSAKPTPAKSTPVIDLGYARYQGEVNASTNVTSFLGIRYAAAPTGDLRFRAPQPPPAVGGVQYATVQPNQCFQAGIGLSPTSLLRTRDVQVGTSEDCLFLSVTYPSDTGGVPARRLPVLVFIHGGGHVLGAACQYPGQDLVAQSARGVVVVVIQYRLGLFGFLAGSAMKKNGALNIGLRDQDFALRWVNEHISKFGGDPAEVTIWGESAGAGSVLQHVVANNGQTKPQLFRAAIASSTYLLSQYNYNHRIPELLYSEVLAQTNCIAAEDSVACLRSVEATVLEAVNENISAAGFSWTLSLLPVVDGEFIRQRPTLALSQGKVNGKALLTITNSFERSTFVDGDTYSIAATKNMTEYALNLFPNFGSAEARRVDEVYAGLGTPLTRAAIIYGESTLLCPTYSLLRAFGGRAFKGEFAIPPGEHGSDLPYYFGSWQGPDASNFFNNTQFINAFAQSFTSFAISLRLDPNVKIDPASITPRWNPFNSLGAGPEMRFNKTEGGNPDVRPVRTDGAMTQPPHQLLFLKAPLRVFTPNLLDINARSWRKEIFWPPFSAV